MPKKLFKQEHYETTDCECGAVNHSHTRACYRKQLTKTGHLEAVTCWCCGGRIVAIHSLVWTGNGAQCLSCWNDCRHSPVCNKFRGHMREWPAGDASALGAMYQMAVMAGLEVGKVWPSPKGQPLDTPGTYHTVMMASDTDPIVVGDWITLDKDGRARKLTKVTEAIVGVAAEVKVDVSGPITVTVQVAGQAATKAKASHAAAQKIAQEFDEPQTQLKTVGEPVMIAGVNYTKILADGPVNEQVKFKPMYPILMMPPGSMTAVPITGTDKKGKTDLKAAKERAVHELLEGETEKQKVGRNFRPILLED